MKTSILALAVFVVTGSGLASADDAKDLAYASGLLGAGQYELALDVTSRLASADLPAASHAEVVFIRGEALRPLGRVSKADSVFDGLLRDYPDSEWTGKALYRRTVHALDRGSSISAKEFVRELEECCPESSDLPDALRFLGASLLNERDYEQAREILARWQVRFGDREDRWEVAVLLARAELALERPEKALVLSALVDSSTRAAEHQEGVLVYMEALRRSGRCSELVERFDALNGSITSPLLSSRADLLLAQCRAEIGRTTEAISLLRHLISGPATNATENWRLMVDAHLALARAILSASPPMDPRLAFLHYDDAHVFAQDIRNGTPSGIAGDELEDVLFETLNLKGISAYRLGDLQVAARAFRRLATDSVPVAWSMVGRMNLAEVLAKSGNLDEALSVLEPAAGGLSKRLGWETARLLKASILEKRERWDEAISALGDIPASATGLSGIPVGLIDPRSATETVLDLCWVRGRAYLGMDLPHEAAGWFDTSLAFAGPDLETGCRALLALAEADLQGGEYEAAATASRRVLRRIGVPLPIEAGTPVPATHSALAEEACFNLAASAEGMDDFQAAADLYRTVRGIFPRGRFCQDTYLREGGCYERAAAWNDAAEVYQSLVAQATRGKKVNRARRHLAHTLRALLRTAQATQVLLDLVDVLQSEPGEDRSEGIFEELVRFDLGMFYLSDGLAAEAVQVFQANMERFPEGDYYERNLFHLGQGLYNRGLFSESASAFERLVEERPGSPLLPDSILNAGWAYERQGMTVEAVATWRRLSEIYPESAAAPVALAAIAQKAESEGKAEAASEWENLAMRFPESVLAPRALFRAALLHFRSLEAATAVEDLTHYRRMFPSEEGVLESYYWQAKAEESLGHATQALALYDEFLRQSTESIASSPLAIRRGDAVLGKTRLIKSTQGTDKALLFLRDRIDSGSFEFSNIRRMRFSLGMLYREEGDTQSAIRGFQEIVKARRGDTLEAEAQFEIARCLAEQGDLDGAISEFLRVIHLYEPLDEVTELALLGVAELFEQRKNYREAIRHYGRAARMTGHPQRRAQAEERIRWLNDHLDLLELNLTEDEGR